MKVHTFVLKLIQVQPAISYDFVLASSPFFFLLCMSEMFFFFFTFIVGYLWKHFIMNIQVSEYIYLSNVLDYAFLFFSYVIQHNTLYSILRLTLA